MVMNNANPRNSSIELLRLVLMFLIIMHHSIVHGMGLMGMAHDNTLPMYFTEWEKPLATIINCCCICAVNCFVLISGYFSIKTTVKKFCVFLTTILIYTLLFDSLYYLSIGKCRTAVGCLLIFSHPSYWFVSAYIYLMAFAPGLNMVFHTMSLLYQKFVLAVMIIVSCYLGFVWGYILNIDGYNLFQMIMMYCIGRFMACQRIEISRYKALIIYFLCALTAGTLMYLLWHFHHPIIGWHMVCYNNPLIVLAAIGLFFFFKSFRGYNLTINKYATSAFAIYLVQSSELCESFYYKLINWCHAQMGGGIWLIIILLAICVIIFSICSDQLLKPMIFRLASKIETFTYWLKHKI